jgi:DNA-binding beta-propeller fold protein YncE
VTDPIDVKAAPNGTIYVLSRSASTIFQYDSGGNTIRSLSSIGNTPTGLDVDSQGNVYIAISGANQVAKFNPTSTSFQLDNTFGSGGYIGNLDLSAGSGDGEFNSPFDVAVSPDGQEIAVSDSGNNRIQTFDTTGSFLASFGQYGNGFGQLNQPKGLAYDARGVLYIIDSGNNRVGVSLSSDIIGTSGVAGNGLGQFQGPMNLGIGQRGFYIVDTGNNRVQLFDAKTGGVGDPPELLKPRGVLSTESGFNQPSSAAAVDDLLQERLYVADTGNNRVVLITISLDVPDGAWTVVTQHLLNADVAGAVENFSSLTAAKYRGEFLAIGNDALAPMISEIPTLLPVFIGTEQAEYYFQQAIEGQSITFPVEFIKENGVWKVMEF